jgi:hypothetical protein
MEPVNVPSSIGTDSNTASKASQLALRTNNNKNNNATKMKALRTKNNNIHSTKMKDLPKATVVELKEEDLPAAFEGVRARPFTPHSYSKNHKNQNQTLP